MEISFEKSDLAGGIKGCSISALWEVWSTQQLNQILCVANTLDAT